ncbi:hypothetical protein Fmac_014497 [Flemingia macrophylla]|uniref:protein-serine/threonine phosphatase n=1 Tax=Flemingia macrophylla TaxID=520843 RepID=A0ABD1MBY3_9FABA
MAGICCAHSRRRNFHMLPLKYLADIALHHPTDDDDATCKRPKLSITDCHVHKTLHHHHSSKAHTDQDDFDQEDFTDDDDDHDDDDDDDDDDDGRQTNAPKTPEIEEEAEDYPKFGLTSVCGRRRDMEDSVCALPAFTREGFHYFGVFDGHGCSHVASMCRERLHLIVNEEIRTGGESHTWKSMMEIAFARMDDEVFRRTQGERTLACRCELRTPHCEAVGSTAVVAILTPEKIVVSNCGDSRAVLCRNGYAIPLSLDHKPDRPDELLRVQARGGRVIYWDGPRVLGVLAMSRAIGDNYLKPFVISEPEVTVTERSDEDECLILASDGLWDVVSNETACGVVKMCLMSQKRRPPSPPASPGAEVTADGSDRACSDASILLTKLALARQSADNVSVVVIDLRKERVGGGGGVVVVGHPSNAIASTSTSTSTTTATGTAVN